MAEITLEKIRTIVPIPTLEELDVAEFFKSDVERTAYQWLFDEEVAGWRQTMRTSARLYARLGEETGQVSNMRTHSTCSSNARRGRKASPCRRAKRPRSLTLPTTTSPSWHPTMPYITRAQPRAPTPHWYDCEVPSIIRTRR